MHKFSVTIADIVNFRLKKGCEVNIDFHCELGIGMDLDGLPCVVGFLTINQVWCPHDATALIAVSRVKLAVNFDSVKPSTVQHEFVLLIASCLRSRCNTLYVRNICHLLSNHTYVVHIWLDRECDTSSLTSQEASL